MARGEAATTRIKVSSELKFQCILARKIPQPRDLFVHIPATLQRCPGLFSQLTSLTCAGHPQHCLCSARADPQQLPLQLQAQIDLQHGQANYTFVYLMMQWKSKENWQIQTCYAGKFMIFWKYLEQSLFRDYIGGNNCSPGAISKPSWPPLWTS